MPGHAHVIYTAGPAHGNFKKCVVRVASLSLPLLRYTKKEGGGVGSNTEGSTKKQNVTHSIIAIIIIIISANHLNH